MQAPQHESITTMSVDVRLCGSIPRRDMKDVPSQGAPPSLKSLTSRAKLLSTASRLAEVNGCKSESTHTTISLCDGLDGLIGHKNCMKDVQQQRLVPVLEPPSWATPAKGDARLEPVCEAVGRQSAVDLTCRAYFRIGRSPSSDVQLMHATSSRRHAMLFHHANGSCYIVDCGSAHGTFVNGVRIASPANGGVVVPHKVRRGSLIRFGGPGAPCFMLKSFSFNLGEITTTAEDTPDRGELVRRNTRLNALGRTALEFVRNGIATVAVARKRSFDSLSSSATLDEEEPSGKRMRCSSPPLSPEQPLRLVSPDLPSMIASKPRRVHFSKDPPQLFYPALVTPEELSSEEDNDY